VKSAYKNLYDRVIKNEKRDLYKKDDSAGVVPTSMGSDHFYSHESGLDRTNERIAPHNSLAAPVDNKLHRYEEEYDTVSDSDDENKEVTVRKSLPKYKKSAVMFKKGAAMYESSSLSNPRSTVLDLDKKDEPIVEKDDPIDEEDEPIVEKDDPIDEEDESIDEEDEPIHEEDEPIVEEDEPIHEKVKLSPFQKLERSGKILEEIKQKIAKSPQIIRKALKEPVKDSPEQEIRKAAKQPVKDSPEQKIKKTAKEPAKEQVQAVQQAKEPVKITQKLLKKFKYEAPKKGGVVIKGQTKEETSKEIETMRAILYMNKTAAKLNEDQIMSMKYGQLKQLSGKYK
jgi:hypothetical protein